MSVITAITAIIIGFLAREWIQLIGMGLNWLRHRRKLTEFVEQSNLNLKRMKDAGLIEDYEVVSYDLTGPLPVCNINVGSKKALRNFKVVRPEDS